MSQKLGMFPPLNVKGANLHLIEPRKPSELALSDVQKVTPRLLWIVHDTVHVGDSQWCVQATGALRFQKEFETIYCSVVVACWPFSVHLFCRI
jgi:hypothetical protein